MTLVRIYNIAGEHSAHTNIGQFYLTEQII